MANSSSHGLSKQHFLRSILTRARLLLTDVTAAELLAEEATRTHPWPPADTRMLRYISQASFEVDDFFRVVELLHKRLKKFERKRWRKAYKTLILVEYVLTHGPLSFANELQADKGVIQQMCSFQYVDEKGYNWGLTVKKKAERVLKLLEKGPFLHQERDRLRKTTRGIQGFDSFSISWPSTGRIEEDSQIYRNSLPQNDEHCKQQDVDAAAKWNSDADEETGEEENPSKENSDDKLVLIGYGGASMVGRKVHPAEELMPLLSCEEGREVLVLSHQL
ncbi:epsin-3-like [Canna indica]|uniref:Epsin-3-like n=1 Tax=Canna indica TaxID=4628 RepID=A0AAQ3JXD4_9LILI|nr:epsin-3-like [Canna indica]